MCLGVGRRVPADLAAVRPSCGAVRGGGRRGRRRGGSGGHSGHGGGIEEDGSAGRVQVHHAAEAVATWRARGQWQWAGIWARRRANVGDSKPARLAPEARLVCMQADASSEPHTPLTLRVVQAVVHVAKRHQSHTPPALRPAGPCCCRCCRFPCSCRGSARPSSRPTARWPRRQAVQGGAQVRVAVVAVRRLGGPVLRARDGGGRTGLSPFKPRTPTHYHFSDREQ